MLSKDHSPLITAIAATSCLVLGFVVGFTTRGIGEANPRIDRAICVFGENQPISGYVRFAKRLDGRTYIQWNITGMQGLHGIHIHELGNLGDNCRAAGGHFNPFSAKHGGPTSSERHVGDLGNLDFVNQTATISMEDPIDLLNGDVSIIGRSLVLHQGEDDLGRGTKPTSLINGGSGPRMSCCIIAIDRS